MSNFLGLIPLALIALGVGYKLSASTDPVTAIRSLSAESYSTRQRASSSLVGMSEKALPFLLEAAPKESPAVRGQIADVVGVIALGMDDPSVAVSFLIGALDDADAKVRQSAASALAYMHAKAAAATERLALALDDPVRLVRTQSIAALHNIGPLAAAATGPLLRLFADPDLVLAGSAASALGEIRADEAHLVRILIAGLDVPPPPAPRTDEAKEGAWLFFRESCLYALGKFGSAAEAARTRFEVLMGDDSVAISTAAHVAFAALSRR